MGASPLPDGSNIADTVRRLKAIDAEFFSLYAASGVLGDLVIEGDVTVAAGGTLQVGDIVSTNWDGTLPLDLSTGADTGMTEGYGLDASAGILQVKQIFAAPGTALVPALTYADVDTTGLFFFAAGFDGAIGFSIGGALALTIDETGIAASAGYPLSLGGFNSSELKYRNLPTARSGTTAVLYSNGTDYDLVPTSSTKRHKKNISRRDQLKDINLIPSRYKRKGQDGWEYGLIVEDLIEQDEILGIWDQNLNQFNDYDTRGVIAVLAAKVNDLEERLDTLVASLGVSNGPGSGPGA